MSTSDVLPHHDPLQVPENMIIPMPSAAEIRASKPFVPATEREMKARIIRRFDRAMGLNVKKLGGGSRYMVWGGAEPHYVDLEGRDGVPKCDCGAYAWSGEVCKHQVAARLHAGDQLSPNWRAGLRADVLRVEIEAEARRAHYHAKLAAEAA